MQHLDVPTNRSIEIQRLEGNDNRMEESGKSYILNTANYPVYLNYVLRAKNLVDTIVGPSSDAILPGQFKEIGASPNVIWRISRA